METLLMLVAFMHLFGASRPPTTSALTSPPSKPFPRSLLLFRMHWSPAACASSPPYFSPHEPTFLIATPLQDALITGRMRLVDTFKEFDKDGDNLLGAEELLKLIKKLVPGAGPAHARCGEVCESVGMEV